MLRTRLLSIAILLPVVLLLLYLGGLPWLAGALLAGILAWREMAQLLRRANFAVYRWLGYVAVPLLIGEAFLHSSGLVTQTPIGAELAQVDLLRPLLAALIIATLILALFDRGEHPTADWGMTLASALYLGFMMGYFVTLRERTNGMWWVLLAFVLTWAIDGTAYFVGRLLGRHKWWPRLSPKKTWEGLIGGSLAGMIAGPLLGWWWLQVNPGWGLLLGILAAILAPLGDLSVSLFKRMAGAKDTSNLIPGHGGVLDRMDSLLFIFPLVTYFALFVAGP